jgi:hypothetical protein
VFEVQRSRLQRHQEHRVDHFSAEASEIGLPVGEWPERLNVAGLGNGLHFYPIREIRADDGSFGGLVYAQTFGCVRIHVFND